MSLKIGLERLERIPVLSEQSRISRFFTQDDLMDEVTIGFLKNTDKAKKAPDSFWPKMFSKLPQGAQSRIGGFLGFINNLPGVSKLPIWAKGSVVFAVLGSAISAGVALFKGYNQAEGSTMDKLGAGANASMWDALKSLAVNTVSIIASVKVPALLGMSIAAIPGIVVGFIASTAAGILVEKIFFSKKNQPNPFASKPQESQQLAPSGPMTHQQIDAMVQKMLDDNMNRRGKNPFSTGGDVNMEKLLKSLQ